MTDFLTTNEGEKKEVKIYNVPEEVIEINLLLLAAFSLMMQGPDYPKGLAEEENKLIFELNRVIEYYEILTNQKMPKNLNEMEADIERAKNETN